MRKHLVVLVALCLALAGLAGVANAKMVLKYGHVAPPFHGQSKGVEAFAAYVKEKTKGEIEIKTFPMGQLGPERSMAEQVQAGTLDMATITTAVLSNFVPEVAVMDLPFVFPNRKTAYAVIDDKGFQKKIFSYLPAKGFVGIGWTENEFRDINTVKTAIRKPADLKGLKIRVMNSPIFIDTFKRLGANPVGLPFPEIYGALQQGVIDAQENPLYTSILIKATEVAKHVTNTDHMLTECIVIVNPDLWARLTPAQKKIFQEAADFGIKVNREVTAAQMKKMFKLNISIEEYIKKNNIKYVELTTQERAAFVRAVKPVWKKYRKIVGEKFFDYFLGAIKKHQVK